MAKSVGMGHGYGTRALFNETDLRATGYNDVPGEAHVHTRRAGGPVRPERIPPRTVVGAEDADDGKGRLERHRRRAQYGHGAPRGANRER